MSLKKKAVSGIVWTIIDAVFTRGIGLISSVLLARLLSPREFGLMGMIYIFTTISTNIADSGLGSSLIREKEVDNKDYSTVFFTNVGLSFLLYAILFFTSQFIADFYKEPELVDIIRVYGLIFIISSFSSIQMVLLSKVLDFKTSTILNIPGTVISSILGIWLAYKGYKVWSIVYMQLSSQLIFSILIWTKSNWIPKFEFSFTKLKKHFNFGYKMTLIGFVNSIFENLYNVVLGKFFTVNTLGEFERARTFNNYPVRILTSIINKVTYPLLSTVQDDKERLQQGYKKIMIITFFVSLPLMLILSAVSEQLIVFLLGKKWEQTAYFFKILCFAGTLYPIHAFNMNLLKVYGKANLLLRVELLKKIINIILVFIALPFGIEAIAWSIVAYSLIALLFNTYYTDKFINYSLWQQVKDNFITIMTGFIVYAFINLFLYSFSGLDNVLKVIISILGGGILFLGLNLAMKNNVLALIKDIRK